jgi:hypothetical protein
MQEDNDVMKNTLKKFGALAIVLAAVVAILPASDASAAKMRGMLYLDGDIVRTFVVPAPLPNGGIDPLYMVTNGVQEQLGITSVGPGYPDYHGGAWAIYTVTFDAGVTPYLLTSDEDVEEAEAAGDVTVTRHPELDNRCPVMP